MAANACDYAFSNPSPAGLHAAGIGLAGRYVGPGSDSKLLHAAERDSIFAAGLGIFLLVEGAASSALGGRATGVEHGKQALAGARALGAPDSAALYAAVDFDVTEAQWPTVRAYLQGFSSVVGLARTGVYGGIWAVRWAARDNVAKWLFQTYAWSGGLWYGGNHIEQYQNGVSMAGGVVDLCRTKKPNVGQWTGGDDMALSDDDIARFWAYMIGSPGLNMNAPAQDWLKQAEAARRAAVDAAKPNVVIDQAMINTAVKSALQDPAVAAGIAKAVNDDAAARLAH